MRALLVAVASLGIVAGRPGRTLAQAPPVSEYTRPIVLFVRPDSAGLQRMRVRMGDDAFYVTADDAMWYQAQAFDLLDSLRVPYAAVERGPMRFRVRGEAKTYAWDDEDAAWFVVIYDGASPPKLSSSLDLRDEVERLRPTPPVKPE